MGYDLTSTAVPVWHRQKRLAEMRAKLEAEQEAEQDGAV